MLKKMIGKMTDYEDRKKAELLSIEKLEGSVSGDDYVVRLKRFNPDTGKEAEPEIHMTTTKDLDLRIAEIEGLIAGLETEKGRLETLREDLKGLE